MQKAFQKIKFLPILCLTLFLSSPDSFCGTGDCDKKVAPHAPPDPSDVGCNFGGGGKNKWYLDFIGSPDLAFRTLETPFAELDNHVLQRENTEDYAIAFSAGARVSLVTSGGLSLRTGLIFSQITEKLDYSNTVLSTDNPDWDLFPTAVEGERQRVTYNKYNHLDVPIILGLEKGKGPFRINFNAGIYVNTTAWQKGSFVDPLSEELVDFSSDNENAFPAFRDRVGISFYGGIAATYELNRDFQLIFEPHYRHYQKSHTAGTYGVEQFFKTAGIFLGIRKVL